MNTKHLFKSFLLTTFLFGITNLFGSAGVSVSASVTCDRVTITLNATDDSADQYDNVTFTMALPKNIAFVQTVAGGDGTLTHNNGIVTWVTDDTSPHSHSFIVRALQPATYTFTLEGVDNGSVFHTHSDSATVSIPAATNTIVNTAANTAITIRLGDLVTGETSITVPSAPTQGSLDTSTPAAANFDVVYTPNTDFVGYDSFTYEALDGSGCPGRGTVFIAVGGVDAAGSYANFLRRIYNTPTPRAACPVAGIFTVEVETSSTDNSIDAGLYTDLSNAALPVVYSEVSTSGGSITAFNASTGVITYDAPGMNGTETIVYKVVDANGCESQGTITINSTTI